MSYASTKPPSRSPDPNRRRCRQCQEVSTGLVAVGQRKLSSTLWDYYHEACIPDLSESGRVVYRDSDNSRSIA